MYKSLVKFIPKYFFDAIINGIVFLISFLDCSLSVYRNTAGLKHYKSGLQKGTGDSEAQHRERRRVGVSKKAMKFPALLYVVFFSRLGISLVAADL